MAPFLYISLLLFQPYLLGSDVGPFWSQGLEGSSVSTGCEIRKLWKGWRKFASLLLLPLSVVLRCGTITVARIRRNFCRKLWKGWWKFASLFYFYPYLLGSDVGQLCSPEGTSVSIGCEISNILEGVTKICSGVSWFVRYRDWNRLE